MTLRHSLELLAAVLALLAATVVACVFAALAMVLDGGRR